MLSRRQILLGADALGVSALGVDEAAAAWSSRRRELNRWIGNIERWRLASRLA